MVRKTRILTTFWRVFSSRKQARRVNFSLKTAILTGFWRALGPRTYPHRLRINGRGILNAKDFREHDRLYIACRLSHFDKNGDVPVQSIKFPDVSNNWGRFSLPCDLWFRENGKRSDGCYAITVANARFEALATPVHSLLQEPVENYSHCEIRELADGETVYDTPPPERKVMTNIVKQRYRGHIWQTMNMLIYPKGIYRLIVNRSTTKREQ